MTAAPSVAHRARGARAAGIGLAVALALIVLAMAIPAVLSWDVRANSFPPLHAEWMPRLGPGSAVSIALAVAGVIWAPRAISWRWGWLLAAVFGYGLAWMIALGAVDGLAGLGDILEHKYEYLPPARKIDNVGAMLEEYTSRIPYSAAPRNWRVHLAGHPPGAVLVFIGLIRLGLGDATTAGLILTVVGASTAVAVMITARRLGGETLVRRAAPFLAAGPAAIWIAVSADGMFAAVAAWGMAALAVSATSRRWWAVGLGGIVAGLLLGYCVMLSYGLPLLGVLAVTILVLARAWQPLLWAVPAALAVVGYFALAGFVWWEALPVLTERYWDGIASRRPPEYWMWGNLAALAFSAGPIAGAAVAVAGTAFRSRRRPVIQNAGGRVSRPVSRRELRGRMSEPGGGIRGRGRMAPVTVVAALCLAGMTMVLLADLSQMSRGEVERIWLPFVPWILVGTALLPERWLRPALALQLGFALAVQHLLHTGW